LQRMKKQQAQPRPTIIHKFRPRIGLGLAPARRRPKYLLNSHSMLGATARLDC
jgi:hypothetical protein